MIRVMSSVGRPTDVSTMIMVTNPAWGIPAAPILAAVAVILRSGEGDSVEFMTTMRNIAVLDNFDFGF